MSSALLVYMKCPAQRKNDPNVDVNANLE